MKGRLTPAAARIVPKLGAGLVLCLAAGALLSGGPALAGGHRPAAAEASPTASSTDDRPGTGRLPRVAVPVAYNLHFTVDPRRDSFSGRGRIDLDVQRPTDRLWLHAVDLDVEVVRVNAGGAALDARIEASPDAGPRGSFAHGERVILFPTEIPAGRVSVELRWEGRYPAGLYGLYRAEEDGRWYAYTQFEVLEARRAFPCLDEPGYKVPFTLALTVPESSGAFANTPEVSRETRGDQVTVRFAPTAPLPTYLLAFAVGPFDVVQGPPGRVPIRGLAAPGKGPLLAEGLRMHAEMLPLLEEYFDSPFPFPKLDVVAVVEFEAGAMENPGLITYREEALLIDPKTTSEGSRRRIATVVAHEMAHLWFGDLVTLAWWDDLWLNEAFAEWTSDKIVDRWRPEYDEALGSVTSRAWVLGSDALDTSRPIRSLGLADAELDFTAFGKATFKGALVLSMIEHWIGEDAFRDGVRRYLKERAWGSATSADLFAALEEVSSQDVSRVTETFLDLPGIPLVVAEPRCEAGANLSVNLRQMRFRPLGSEQGTEAPAKKSSADPDALWAIPVCLQAGKGRASRETCVLLDRAQANFDLESDGCPDWVHANAGEWGYYRWALTGGGLRGLADLARSDGLGERERAALPDQAWAMVASGRLDPSEYLDLLDALSPVTARRQLEPVVTGIERVADAWERVAEDEAFRAWVRATIGDQGRRLGWSPQPGEPADDTLLRPTVLKVLGELGTEKWVLDGAAEHARAWLKEPASVPPELAPVALGLAVQQGEVGFRELRRALKRARTPAERRAVVDALGSLPPGRDLDRALELSLTRGVRQQDVEHIWDEAMSRPESRDRTFAMMERRFDALAARLEGFGDAAPGAGMPSWVGDYCTIEGRDHAADFFRRKAIQGSERALGTGLARADQCIALRQFGNTAIDDWLHERARR